MTTATQPEPSVPPLDTLLPGKAPSTLAPYIESRVITRDDVAAVAMLVAMAQRDEPSFTPDPFAWIGMCLAVRTPRDGHTCVELSSIGDWCGDIDLTQDDHLAWPLEAAAWTGPLAAATPLVGEPGSRAPFILEGTRLYLARSLHEEEAIAQRLSGADGANVEILLGGPGTGKTTNVATRLIELLRTNPEAQIALAAPTGKAAARMAEALKSRLHDANTPESIRNASQEVRDKVENVRPVTIHQLLGYRPHGTPRYKYRPDNQLDSNIVVIDEASMLSSSMMHHLLAAVGKETRLLLVGDPNQLASVDAGTVLGDIARAASREGSPLFKRTETLRIRHRFGPRIGALADAILEPDGAGLARAFEILEGHCDPPPDPDNTKPDNPQSIRWLEPGSPALKGVIDDVVRQAESLRALAKRGAAAEALAAQKQLQVICAHRAGPMGVAGWNARVEKGLGVGGWNPWYSGRPIMVTRNNPALDLFNGDVGIVVPEDKDHPRAVAFPQATGEPRRVSISQLEELETVHALTIHKSQGSEYDHVVVVLPERASRILTKELLYTAVTRAAERVTVVGSREVIAAAINRPIRRATGLTGRL